MHIQVGNLRRLGAVVVAVCCGLAVAGALQAQTLSSNALTVKVIDPIDSAQATAGQRFHAVVAKDTAIAGVFLAKGADATITLVPGTGGNRWTLNLIEVTVNGKVAGVYGANPVVVPTSAGDFFTMSKKTASTKDRIAVAAGENVKFTLSPPPPAQSPAAAAGNAPAAVAPVRGVAAPVAPPDPSAAYRNAAVAGPNPGQYTFIGPFGSVLYGKFLHIEARLDGCARQGTATSTCDFSIWDRNPIQAIGMGIGGFALVDGKGQVVDLSGEGAKCCDGRNQSTIVPGVVSHAHYTYGGLDPDVTSLARVSIKIYQAGSGGNDDFEFRNVPLGTPAPNPQAFTPTDVMPRKLVAEDNGLRVTVERCSPTVRKNDPDYNVIECFFKVENLKADRGIVPWPGSFFVDDHGRTHDSIWYPFGAGNRAITTDPFGTVGDAAAYARMSAVPEADPAVPGYGLDAKTYNQPPIKYGEPRYMFGVFATVPKDVKHIVHLEYNFREPGAFNNFSVSFDDVDLTPMPPVKAAVHK
jgi:hypothetical protein